MSIGLFYTHIHILWNFFLYFTKIALTFIRMKHINSIYKCIVDIEMYIPGTYCVLCTVFTNGITYFNAFLTERDLCKS